MGATSYKFSVWDFDNNNNTIHSYYQFNETLQIYTNSGFGFTIPGDVGDGSGILPVTVTNGVSINTEFQTIFQVSGNCTLGQIKEAYDI